MEKEELAQYIGNKIKEMRISQGKTQEDLALLLNTTKQSIGRYENGSRRANQDLLFELADIFDCSINDFFPPIETTASIESIYNQLDQPRKTKVYNFADRQLREQKYGVADAGKIVPLKPRKKIPVDIYGRLSAGGGAYNDKSVIETVEVDSAPSKYDMAFVVTGDSMYPTFEDGEVVFVNETQDVFNGQIAAIEINNEAFIKKIYLEGKRMRMVSLNVDTDKNGKRLYPDFYADECDNLFVIGRVIM